MATIETRDLRKSFTAYRRREGSRFRRDRTQVHAVDSIDLEVASGEVVGYIGPNGAGKSTTVKMLTGILTPTSGHVRVLGLEPTRQRVSLARRIGVVFGQRTQLWWDLPLRDSFELIRHIYRVPPAEYRKNLDEFRRVLELDGFLDTPVRQLSLGQRMRGDLAAAMLHEPEILFLDEPTIGLDVVAKARIRDFLLRANTERGVTILLTTHDMSDVERLCGRILIIDEGRIVYDGGLQALRRRFGGETVLIVDLSEAADPLVVPGAEVTRVQGPRQWLRFRRSETTAAGVIAAVATKASIVDLALEDPPIEEVVRRLYLDRGSG